MNDIKTVQIKGEPIVTYLEAPTGGVEVAFVIHLPTRRDGVLDNTTTSGRYLWGPATLTRTYYDDGACNTVEYDYAPNATFAELRAVK